MGTVAGRSASDSLLSLSLLLARLIGQKAPVRTITRQNENSKEERTNQGDRPPHCQQRATLFWTEEGSITSSLEQEQNNKSKWHLLRWVNKKVVGGANLILKQERKLTNIPPHMNSKNSFP